MPQHVRRDGRLRRRLLRRAGRVPRAGACFVTTPPIWCTLPHFKVDKCYDQSKLRLTMSMGRLAATDQDTVRLTFGVLGAERKVGRAPASALEDQLETWLYAVSNVGR